LFLNFLHVKLNEEGNTVSGMPSLPSPSTPDEMIDASRPLVELIFDKDAMAEHTISECGNWPSIMEVP
jgi:hypothetical protein